MLVNLFVFWILVSVFFGGREANRAIGKIFGFLAFFWAMGLILRIRILCSYDAVDGEAAAGEAGSG